MTTAFLGALLREIPGGFREGEQVCLDSGERPLLRLPLCPLAPESR